MNPTAQDPANEDLHHALANGVTLPQLAARSSIPPHTLACIMSRETGDTRGGKDAEIRNAGDLRRILAHSHEKAPRVQ